MSKEKALWQEVERDLISCRKCFQWKRDGYCRPRQRIIKATDRQHFCAYYQED